MKKFILVTLLLFLVLTISGCANLSKYLIDFGLIFDTNTSEDETTISSSTIITSSTNTTTISSSNTSTTTITSTTTQADIFTPTNLSTYNDIKYSNSLMPSTGNVNAIVMQVGFTDYVTSSYTKTQVEDAFFGNATDTGWQSLKSYYETSSYNQLHIDGIVTDIYQSGLHSSAIVDYDDVKDLLFNTLNYFNSSIDYTNYDSDNDGYIDAIYLLYTAPYDFDNEFWAYQATTFSSNTYDAKGVAQFVWASLDFLDYHSVYSGLNASTYIHETGHLMGADDYYDYDEAHGSPWGTGGADIMDSTIGDHNPFTKMMYGWTTPRVITNGTHTITLDKFSETGDTIIIKNNWNDNLDEYFIIDYYDNGGLDATYSYSSDGGGFGTNGIRIYHVNATYTGNHIYEGNYPNILDYDNSDTFYGLLQLCEKTIVPNNSFNVMGGYYAESNDLFKVGNLFNPLTISTDQFIDQDNLNFTVYVNSLSDTATITISFDN